MICQVCASTAEGVALAILLRVAVSATPPLTPRLKAYSRSHPTAGRQKRLNSAFLLECMEKAIPGSENRCLNRRL